MKKTKKKGAQLGNQNARKHGFYSRVLEESLRIDLDEAVAIDGLDEEIGLLRLKLRELLDQNSDKINLELALSCANTIARLVRTRYNISAGQKRSLKDAITKVLTEIAVPLGVKTLIK